MYMGEEAEASQRWQQLLQWSKLCPPAISAVLAIFCLLELLQQRCAPCNCTPGHVQG